LDIFSLVLLTYIYLIDIMSFSYMLRICLSVRAYLFNFSQLPVDGQSRLKDYLKSFISLQNTITGVSSVDKIPIPSKEI